MLLCRVGLLSLAFVLSACDLGAADPDPKPAELIIGRWPGEATLTIKTQREGQKQEVEVFTRKVWTEFGKDGSVTITEGDISELKTRLPDDAKGGKTTGTYVFAKDTEVEVTFEEDGMKVTRRAKVEITRDEMTVTPIVKGKEQTVEKYKRVKE